MSEHQHDWKQVSQSADNSTVEYACADADCGAEKTEFAKKGGPAVAESAPAEPRRVFGSASSAEFIEPE